MSPEPSPENNRGKPDQSTMAVEQPKERVVKLPSLSPSALNRFLACEYRTYLDMLDHRGELDAKRRPPPNQALLERGEEFESQVLADFEAENQTVVRINEKHRSKRDRAAATLEAMRAGVDVVYQGCFQENGWVGYPDFLIRVEDPSALGSWSYEVHDSKLGASERTSHVFQLLAYTDALARLQGRRPKRMFLILGDGSRPNFAPDDFSAYAQRVGEVFQQRAAELEAGATPAYPYPVAACDFCDWWHVCKDKRRAEDHISLVAGLQRRQGLLIEQQDIHDVSTLVELDDPGAIPGIRSDTITALRAQAELQLRSRGRDAPLYELLAPEAGRGLARLPKTSAGDVYFDFEGDPHWGDEGLEYLFGSVFEDADGSPKYDERWATSRAEEKAALEGWFDWIAQRLEAHSDLHIYHYNSYEPTALKRLVARHATREAELDVFLRAGVFVDLYGITRQATRIGIESYGLKAVETVFTFERSPELGDAIGSYARWHRYCEQGDRSLLEEIALYNRDDCLSTRALAGWLRERVPDAEAEYGVGIDALPEQPSADLTDRQQVLAARTEALRAGLFAGLPDDESKDTDDERARRTMFALTGYHTREAKPGWWAFFDRRMKSPEELRDDGDALGDLAELHRDHQGKCWEWILSFPTQNHKIGPGGVDDPIAGTSADVVEIDDATGTILVRRSDKHGAEPPRAVAPSGPIQTDAQIDAVFELAEKIVADGLHRPGIGRDLLLARPPRFVSGTPPLRPGPVQIKRLTAQVRGLDRSVLVVQGPPGTGKTWTGARVALGLMDAGLRVGVMSTAHKAVDNFLKAVDEAADERAVTFRGWRKKHSGGGYSSPRIHCKGKPDEREGPVTLHAGVAWHWSRADAAGSVDVLIVDEAGQISLADAIAVGRGAKSMLLLGDPQQLPHVSQGTHPLSVGVSVLEHLIGEADTIDAHRGVLLDQSWRMHPDLCGFVSRTMYDGRLSAEPQCAEQAIISTGLSGTGLRMLEVRHVGNTGRSQEEADRIATEVERLLAGGTFTDRDGATWALELDHILIVAPYNAQVRCLTQALPEGARVGTVDKFQGQEAPVVFFSMATSTGEDISRGMSFLFSRNRLNVAISRAQALAVVVCSPALLRARCATVEDMRLVNMLCLVADAAAAAG
jgi:predicted RecB family nuclease